MTKEEILAVQAAIAHYGNDPHLYAQQRDGFVSGYLYNESDRDSQTIAGIELALKKCMNVVEDHKAEYVPDILRLLDPAAILSELKNDIKEG